MTDHALRPHANRPPLRPRSLSDLVELVPYLLGFHPRDSLVVVALHGPKRRVGTTVRADRDEFRQCPDLPASLAAYLRADGADEALAVLFACGQGDGRGRDRAGPKTVMPDRELVQKLAVHFFESGVFLVDALYVEGGRWWSYACDDPTCCPPTGRELPAATGKTSPAVAAATFAGLVALPDREALERTLDPVDPISPQDLDRARAVVEAEAAQATRIGQSTRWREGVCGELAAIVTNMVSGAELRLTGSQVARLLVLLADEKVRDACCQWTEGERAVAALELWRHLARRAIPPYNATPFALAAWSAWHVGSGPLARMAVNKALSADPHCRLALLLEEALDRGVNPMTVRGRPRGRRRSRPRVRQAHHPPWG